MRNFKQILDKAKAREKKARRAGTSSRRIYQALEVAEKTGLIIPVPVGALDEAIAMAEMGKWICFFRRCEMAEFIDALTVKGTGIANGSC